MAKKNVQANRGLGTETEALETAETRPVLQRQNTADYMDSSDSDSITSNCNLIKGQN